MLHLFPDLEVVFPGGDLGPSPDPVPPAVAGEGLVGKRRAPLHHLLVDPQQVAPARLELGQDLVVPVLGQFLAGQDGHLAGPGAQNGTDAVPIDVEGPGDGADRLVALLELQDGSPQILLKHRPAPVRKG